MKFKTTKKAMRENYDTIIGIGYCKAQNLLRFEEPIAYSVRAEGWACDYYDVDGVLISTGYAPLKSKNANFTYDTLQRYEGSMFPYLDDPNLNYHQNYGAKKEYTRALLREFIKEAIK